MAAAPRFPPVWLERPTPQCEEVDVAVVGGGIVGLSTAYWLGKAGRRVVLLEAGSLAGRASGRNAGFLLTGSAEPYTALVAGAGERVARRFWEISAENRELLRAEILDTGGGGGGGRGGCEVVPGGGGAGWTASSSPRGAGSSPSRIPGRRRRSARAPSGWSPSASTSPGATPR